ncbi:MAG TPA: hypothetical protein VF211_14240 [Burkholderiales bacterium]
MADLNYLLNARASLEALAELLQEAAEREERVSDIADEALARLNDALTVIDALGEDEGTE